MARSFRVVKGYNGHAFALEFDSTVQRPTGVRRALSPGTVIALDSEAFNGNVWFKTPLGRGKSESGSVANMVRAGVIEEIVSK